jgi:hypothetical protein
MFDNERRIAGFAFIMHQGGFTALQLRSDMVKKFHDFLIPPHLTNKKSGNAEVQRQEACDGE